MSGSGATRRDLRHRIMSRLSRWEEGVNLLTETIHVFTTVTAQVQGLARSRVISHVISRDLACDLA